MSFFFGSLYCLILDGKKVFKCQIEFEQSQHLNLAKNLSVSGYRPRVGVRTCVYEYVINNILLITNNHNGNTT